MTTIVYHKGILATDSLTTQPHGVKSVCPHCNKSHAPNTGASMKIKTNTHNYKLYGNQIIAFAGSGDVAAIKGCYQLLRLCSNETFSPTILLMAMRTYNLDVFRHERNSALIITQEEAVVMKWGDGTIHETRHPLTDTITLGSGQKAAALGIELLGLSADEAVEAASVVDPGTGGSVFWMDTKSKKEDIPIQNRIILPNVAERLRAAHTKPAAPVKKRK